MSVEYFLLPIFGFFVGMIASLTGVGGGIFIVPILTIVYDFVPQHAVGTSLASIVFTALAASAAYARQKRIYYRTGLLFSLLTVPGAYLGAYLTTIVSPSLLGLFFGIFLVFVAGRMVIDLRKSGAGSSGSQREAQQAKLKSDLELVRSGRTIILGLGLSFFAGLASGFFGIGGGALGVPIMTLGLAMPMHAATATSMFTMIFTSISGAVKHYSADHINLIFGLLLALGTVVGAQVGARLSPRISAKNLRRIFGIVLVLTGVRMILKFI